MLLRIATVAWMVLVMDPVVLLLIHKQSLSLCLFKESLEHDKGPVKPKGTGHGHHVVRFKLAYSGKSETIFELEIRRGLVRAWSEW